MRVLRWLFPVGAFLTIGGVFLAALLEHLSWGNTQGWTYPILEQAFLPALLIGTVLAIVGSFIERRRLLVTQTRSRGLACLAVSAVSFLLLVKRGNVHEWTFTFVFPAFVGIVAGLVLLSKSSANNPGVHSDSYSTPD